MVIASPNKLLKQNLFMVKKKYRKCKTPTVPSVRRLLFIYDPSFLLNPVVSVFELSDPARSIKF
jgi:hypothetical protein